MMSGQTSDGSAFAACGPRRYAVIPRAGGWSVALRGICTRPFKSRQAAQRIARALQKQADGLDHTSAATSGACR
jgi:hypothetical protein